MPLESDRYGNILDLAKHLYQSGHFKDARALIQEVEQHGDLDFALAQMASLCEFRLGNLEAAKALILRSLELRETDAAAWNILGEIYRRLGAHLDSAEAFRKCIAADPNFTDAYNNLGNLYADTGDFENAEAAYRMALAINNQHVDAWFNLGNVLFRNNRFSGAIEAYQKALELAPANLGALHNYAQLLARLRQDSEAESTFCRLLELKPDYLEGIVNHGEFLRSCGRFNDAIAILDKYLPQVTVQESIPIHLRKATIYREMGDRVGAQREYQIVQQLDPRNEDAFIGLMNINIEIGDFVTGQKQIREMYDRYPERLELLLALTCLEIPTVYSNEEEIGMVRERYTERLHQFSERLATLSLLELKYVENIIGANQPFYLPYQGLPTKELHTIYGTAIVDAMNRSVLLPPLPDREPTPGRKIRVGIVSGFFRSHSNYKIPVRGWLKHLNREEFEVFGYHTQARSDECTDEAQSLCARFEQGPKELREWITIILKDELDVLIYPEIGMDPMTCKLACLRLAPHQATSWGHPTTSGVPTLDYFLSSELMEPVGADEHYSEKLVRLPNLSFYYEPPIRKILPITRTGIGLRDDAFIYWCCQTTYKYLPQYDWIYPEIASQVPNAQFVFITIRPESEASGIFKERLFQAFKEKGLDPNYFLFFTHGINPDEFSTLASLCDLGLDTIGWSGCNSSLETLAVGTPILTSPSTFMRSRHTSGILTMMGCEELITSTPKKLAERAIVLAHDQVSLQKLTSHISSSISCVYRDLGSVRGLERAIREWTTTKPQA